MNKAPEYRVGIGASSIIMIFIILSLTTLGVLSFASARADMNLSQRRQVQVTAYYEAAAEAQRLIAQVDEALLTARDKEMTPEDRAAALQAIHSGITVTDDGLVSLQVEVSDSQRLDVVLRIEEDTPARYTLTHHHLVNTAEWTPDNTLHLPSTEVAVQSINDM